MNLTLIFALVFGLDSDGGELGWLVGCWATPDNSAQEVWVVNSERSLSGFSVAISDNKIGFYEVLSITQNEDSAWIYTAHPSGQPSASFVAVEIAKNSVVFSNPDHDYPQAIRYKREGDRLYATISLLDGANPTSFDKVACE